MEVRLGWDCIHKDYYTIGSEKNADSITLFDPKYKKNQESIFEETEQQIVSNICKNEKYFELLIKKSNIQGACFAFPEVERSLLINDTNPRGGDFDLIVVNQNKPYELVCFEFKKVKVTATDQNNDKINNLTGIDTLYDQLRDRLKLGFSFVYGVIIIQADLRNRDSANTFLKNISDKAGEEITYQIFKNQEFPQEAGLIFVKYYQPTGKSYKESKSFCVNLAKNPIQLKQSSELTERYFNNLHPN